AEKKIHRLFRQAPSQFGDLFEYRPRQRTKRSGVQIGHRRIEKNLLPDGGPGWIENWHKGQCTNLVSQPRSQTPLGNALQETLFRVSALETEFQKKRSQTGVWERG